ncbi:hypothetical protein X975_11203, partial [Stegodyphus mimosarum]
MQAAGITGPALTCIQMTGGRHIQQVAELIPQLLPEQNHVFHQILRKIESGNVAFCFLDSPGGTGKTFLLNLLLMSIRKDQKIAVAVASCGIAATLLKGDRAAHSVLKLPLSLAQEDSPICNFCKNRSRSRMLRQCKLLAWDEGTVSHKKSYRSVKPNSSGFARQHRSYGRNGSFIGRDFRQTLPVIRRGTPADEIKACLKLSSLWEKVEKFRLKTNMRVHFRNDVDSGNYTETLLKIGDGCLDTAAEGCILLSEEFCNLVENDAELIAKVYQHFQQKLNSDHWLCARVILAPTNEIVNKNQQH